MSAKFIGCVLGVVVGPAARCMPSSGPTAGRSHESRGPRLQAVLKAHAVGTQNYICAPATTATGVDWLFIGPQATLFNDNLEQIGTHYQSRNPLQERRDPGHVAGLARYQRGVGDAA